MTVSEWLKDAWELSKKGPPRSEASVSNQALLETVLDLLVLKGVVTKEELQKQYTGRYLLVCDNDLRQRRGEPVRRREVGWDAGSELVEGGDES